MFVYIFTNECMCLRRGKRNICFYLLSNSVSAVSSKQFKHKRIKRRLPQKAQTITERRVKKSQLQQDEENDPPKKALRYLCTSQSEMTIQTKAGAV